MFKSILCALIFMSLSGPVFSAIIYNGFSYSAINISSVQAHVTLVDPSMITLTQTTTFIDDFIADSSLSDDAIGLDLFAQLDIDISNFSFGPVIGFVSKESVVSFISIHNNVTNVYEVVADEGFANIIPSQTTVNLTDKSYGVAEYETRGEAYYLVRTETNVNVPEPSALALMGLGLLGMFSVNRSKVQA